MGSWPKSGAQIFIDFLVNWFAKHGIDDCEQMNSREDLEVGLKSLDIVKITRHS